MLVDDTCDRIGYVHGDPTLMVRGGGRDIKKRKGAVKEAKAKKPKPAKKVKDPNAPKRPPTAFFIFL